MTLSFWTDRLLDLMTRAGRAGATTLIDQAIAEGMLACLLEAEAATEVRAPQESTS
ncbi:MAG: hypothetical protein NTV05_10560 [Acidobacteria bacterium]|nr:hypothetical protein [Acidobacteriota bacterium]